MGSYDQRIVTTGNGPTITSSVNIENPNEEEKVPKKVHLNLAARAVRPIVMSNSN
jgi:hypothetical protein